MNLAGLRERWVAAPAPDGPDLRVVVERRGHSTTTYVAVLVLSILFLVLFGLAVFHTVLIGAQGRLDRLDARIEEESQRQHDLRLEVARLESPERIVGVATDELGMVPPDDVVWLAPSEPSTDPAPDPRTPSTPREDAGELASGTEPGGGGR